ncbi:MAG TPA: hypothetical protein VGN17_02115 [Bryobacteraceae bacterium]|jgi:hypothetical protein
MICKGTAHNNGAKLARYLVTGKQGERAELWQLIGFAAGDIREAFRSVHVMAEATRCEQPFFHVQVRNPDVEELSREAWLRVANRIESKLGLTGQLRAICFHVNEQTGHEHMHIAWSRIDEETMTARALPFFKDRLKEVAREMEIKLDLTRVRNERDSPAQAPTRDEFEQARRLGVDLHDVRSTIRECWERADCGHSFQAALAENALTLAQGDRRDFLVLDSAGGLYALGKRILGVSASEIRVRLSDIDRGSLPTVEQARQLIPERHTVLDGRMPDPDREERRWHDALSKAAIDKEKTERKFAEPGRPPTEFIPTSAPISKAPQPRLGVPWRSNRSITVPGISGRPIRALGKAADGVAKALESILAPQLTPEQKIDGEVATRERKAETDRTIDVSKLIERHAAEARQAQEREAARQPLPDERER